MKELEKKVAEAELKKVKDEILTYQITVRDKSGTYLWDAVCGWCTYGFPHLLEVCGLALVDHYDVEGWLTARQVMKMWRRRNAAKNR